MSQAAVPTSGSGYTAAGLHHEVRGPVRVRFAFLNAGWIVVGAALLLSIIGILAIGTTDVVVSRSGKGARVSDSGSP